MTVHIKTNIPYLFCYFLLHTWQYFCIVFVCSIVTSTYYDVTELIWPCLFSPDHDCKKINFWRLWSQISLEVFICSPNGINHLNRLAIANFWKKWRLCHMHFNQTFQGLFSLPGVDTDWLTLQTLSSSEYNTQICIYKIKIINTSWCTIHSMEANTWLYTTCTYYLVLITKYLHYRKLQ